ncbi:MAG TPA: hypothetical protein VNQ77_09955 [Frankiaceae bacterium]|nr:hypothetical protein [Frankiaceae bacterium]
MTTHGTHDGSAVEAHEAAAHDDHDDHGGGHGHGADPNAGVLRGEAPTSAWLVTTTVIALVTIAACVWLAVRIG